MSSESNADSRRPVPGPPQRPPVADGGRANDEVTEATVDLGDEVTEATVDLGDEVTEATVDLGDEVTEATVDLGDEVTEATVDLGDEVTEATVDPTDHVTAAKRDTTAESAADKGMTAQGTADGMSMAASGPDTATGQNAAVGDVGEAATDGGTSAIERDTAPTDPGTTAVEHAFGRVTTDGRVFVRTPDGEREVGSWQAGDPAAGLAHFERRFDTLAGQVDLLAARLAAGSVEPAAARSSLSRLRAEIAEANVVGDLTGLLARTDELSATVEERRQERRQARAAERAAALDTRRRIAEEAEQLAASDDWRVAGDRFRQLIEEWKQASSADRAASDELWHRVSRAQSSFRKRRQQHAAALESTRAETVRVKNDLIAEAEALADSTDWRDTSRRMADLMTAWKAAGRARRDVDDELWQRFRAARDRFYEHRHEADNQRQHEFEDRVAVLRGLVAEAEAIPRDSSPRDAERLLRGIRERWAAVGPVPRAMADQWEDRLADVADRVRDADDERRRRQAAASSPMIVTLRQAVAQREARLEKARAEGRTEEVKAAEADLEVQRGWLRQAEQSLRH